MRSFLLVATVATALASEAPAGCCKALTAACVSCTHGTTPEAYCTHMSELAAAATATGDNRLHRLLPGCEQYVATPAAEECSGCCPANAACFAPDPPCCLSPGPPSLGPPAEPRMCCMAVSLNCLSCSHDVTPAEYCAHQRRAPGDWLEVEGCAGHPHHHDPRPEAPFEEGTAGCCFEVGFGARMQECCFAGADTTFGACDFGDQDAAAEGGWVGGVKKFRAQTCAVTRQRVGHADADGDGVIDRHAPFAPAESHTPTIQFR